MKILKLFLVITICINLISCFPNTNTTEQSSNRQNTDTPNIEYELNDQSTMEEDSKYQDIIKEERYYKIYRKKDSFDYCMLVFNDNEETVGKYYFQGKYPTVDLIDNQILDIHNGMGTGIVQHQYYSIKRDCFSGEYFDVIAMNKEIIAYISVHDKNNALEDRGITVRNIFDKTQYYKEFYLPFSKVTNPVICAEFIDGGLKLKIDYYCGDGKNKTTEIFSLS